MPDQQSIYQLLSEVMGEVQSIGKNSRNSQQGYAFRGVDDVVNVVGPAFRRHGIVGPVPHASTAGYRDVRTANDKASREVTVMVTYRFYGPAGDYLECQVPGESMDVGDKGTPKAMSVAYRIALLQVLNIPTDSPDPDSESYERAAAPHRDWIAEARQVTDLQALLDLGYECNAAGEFVGGVREFMLHRRTELQPVAVS
jgi:hypothetical protein